MISYYRTGTVHSINVVSNFGIFVITLAKPCHPSMLGSNKMFSYINKSLKVYTRYVILATKCILRIYVNLITQWKILYPEITNAIRFQIFYPAKHELCHHYYQSTFTLYFVIVTCENSLKPGTLP